MTVPQIVALARGALMTTQRDTRACRITKVTTYVVGMRWRNCVFAHVETDDGINGIGEGSLEYQPQGGRGGDRAACGALRDRALGLRDREAVARHAAQRVHARADHQQRRRRDRNGDVGHRRQGARPAGLRSARRRVHDVLPAYANAWYGVGKTPAEIGAAARLRPRRAIAA